MKKIVMTVSVLLVCSVLMPVLSYGQGAGRIVRGVEHSTSLLQQGANSAGRATVQPQMTVLTPSEFSFDREKIEAIMQALLTDDVEAIKELGITRQNVSKMGRLVVDDLQHPSFAQFTPLLCEIVAAKAEKIFSYLMYDRILGELATHNVLKANIITYTLHESMSVNGEISRDTKNQVPINALTVSVLTGNKSIFELASSYAWMYTDTERKDPLPSVIAASQALQAALDTQNTEFADMLKKQGINESLANAHFYGKNEYTRRDNKYPLTVLEIWENADTNQENLIPEFFGWLGKMGPWLDQTFPLEGWSVGPIIK